MFMLMGNAYNNNIISDSRISKTTLFPSPLEKLARTDRYVRVGIKDVAMKSVLEMPFIIIADK